MAEVRHGWWYRMTSHFAKGYRISTGLLIRAVRGLFLGVVMVLAGCGSFGEPLAADWDCTLPFPSDFFLEDDPGRW
jgi:hypothetical protein